MRAGRGWTATAGAAALLLVAAAAVRAQAPAGADAARDAAPGHAVFDRACAACHLHPETMRAPALATLRKLPAEQIRFALTEGVMRPQGSVLSAAEREQVVSYLAAPPAVGAQAASLDSGAWIEPLRCAPAARVVDLSAAPTVVSAGVDLANTRRLTAARAGLSNADLRRLEVAWTLPLPQTTSLRATPVIVGSTLFYPAAQLGTMLALDTRTGCVKWAKKLARQLRASPAFGVVAGRPMLFVPDAVGTVRALDPRDGAELWAVDPRPDKSTPITGGLVYAAGKVIVPVSASDVGRANDPAYACCKSHGAVVALDAASGRTLWTVHTTDPSKPTGRRSSAGVELWGPSGAPVWSTPSVDEARGLVYVGVGENTSLPATPTSDAILALDLATGERRWLFQNTGHDVWNIGCHKAGHPNCDFTDGESIKRDWDFGMSPMVMRAGGRGVLVVGQKSGHVYGLDPATGRAVWTQRFGTGTSLGGRALGHGGGRRACVRAGERSGDRHGRLQGGRPLRGWMPPPAVSPGPTPPSPTAGRSASARVTSCTTRFGFSASPLVIDRAVVAGQLDGWLRVFDAASGAPLFAFDTARDFAERGWDQGAGRGDRRTIGVRRRRLPVRGLGLRRLRRAAGQRADRLPSRRPAGRARCFRQGCQKRARDLGSVRTLSRRASMRLRSLLLSGACALLASAALAAPPAKLARSVDGHTTFDGVWTNVSITPLERDKMYGPRLVASPQEVSNVEGAAQARFEEGNKPTDPNQDASDHTSKKCNSADGLDCGYNSGWKDSGTAFARVNGEARTSFITSTADGRIPPRKSGAPALKMRAREDYLDRADNPEERGLGERCLTSFGYSGGPVMLPLMYNNNYNFVLTKGQAGHRGGDGARRAPDPHRRHPARSCQPQVLVRRLHRSLGGRHPGGGRRPTSAPSRASADRTRT